MPRKFLRAAVIAVLVLGAVAAALLIMAPKSDAAPLLPLPILNWTPLQITEARLLLGGVNKEFASEIDDSIRLTCGLLDLDPTRGGVDRAMDQLYDRGYTEPYQRGYTLGTIVQVNCSWHVGLITAAR